MNVAGAQYPRVHKRPQARFGSSALPAQLAGENRGGNQ
jgi:hypothetical protein